MELGRGGWSWVELGVRFSNTHCIDVLKCSNFRMLESNVEMFEYFNASKLAEYWCVFLCLFFFHLVVLFVLKMLVTGK